MQVKNLYMQLPQDLWKRVDASRWTLKTKTDRDTVIRLLEIGLDASGESEVEELREALRLVKIDLENAIVTIDQELNPRK
jgi:hypothetical protein